VHPRVPRRTGHLRALSAGGQVRPACRNGDPRVTAAPPLLSIVIPVLDERDNIVGLLDEIASVEGLPDYEIVCVDDGSRDDTAAILRAKLCTTPRLRVLVHARRSGQSAAVRSGVKAARAAWIATLDGDGQNDPA